MLGDPSGAAKHGDVNTIDCLTEPVDSRRRRGLGEGELRVPSHGPDEPVDCQPSRSLAVAIKTPTAFHVERSPIRGLVRQRLFRGRDFQCSD